MAKTRKRKTEELYKRFQAINGLLSFLEGNLNNIKRAVESIECSREHLEKKYGELTTQEMVDEINKIPSNFSETEKNIGQFPKAASAVVNARIKLEALLDSRQKNSIATAIKKLRKEYNKILRELQRRKFSMVANKRKIEEEEV